MMNKIMFKDFSDKNMKTKRLAVLDGKRELGIIAWYNVRKGYVFWPASSSLLDQHQLNAIADKISYLMNGDKFEMKINTFQKLSIQREIQRVFAELNYALSFIDCNKPGYDDYITELVIDNILKKYGCWIENKGPGE